MSPHHFSGYDATSFLAASMVALSRRQSSLPSLMDMGERCAMAMVRPKSCSDRLAHFAKAMFLAFYDGHGRKKKQCAMAMVRPMSYRRWFAQILEFRLCGACQAYFFMKFPFGCRFYALVRVDGAGCRNLEKTTIYKLQKVRKLIT